MGPPDPAQLRREIELRSNFVLVTDDSGRSPRELPAVYKRQQTAVEIPFHRTKALPVARMFLERPERVRAIGYVLLTAYVAVMQRRIRHALAERGEQLLTYDNRRTAMPSGQTVPHHLGEITTISCRSTAKWSASSSSFLRPAADASAAAPR